MGYRDKKEVNGFKSQIGIAGTSTFFTIDYLGSPSAELILNADQDIIVTTNASFDDSPEIAFIPSGTPTKLDNTILDFKIENQSAVAVCNVKVLMKSTKEIMRVGL